MPESAIIEVVRRHAVPLNLETAARQVLDAIDPDATIVLIGNNSMPSCTSIARPRSSRSSDGPATRSICPRPTRQESDMPAPPRIQSTSVHIQAGRVRIEGDLLNPPAAAGLVIFAHGSGSSRFSKRNQSVAQVLVNGGFATLMLDLLTGEEEAIDVRTREYRFDIDRLGQRVVAAIDWAASETGVSAAPVGCFGASTGAAAALIAAAERPEAVKAVISRGGRPDLAGDALPLVQAPTLLIVGGADEPVIELNRQAMRRMRAPVTLEIVPGATHLFEEADALLHVSRLALEWCRQHLSPR
jgi:putative phosphoribosyl transferase